MTAMTAKTQYARTVAALAALTLLALPAVGDAQSARTSSNQPIAFGATDNQLIAMSRAAGEASVRISDVRLPSGLVLEFEVRFQAPWGAKPPPAAAMFCSRTAYSKESHKRNWLGVTQKETGGSGGLRNGQNLAPASFFL